jgi:hypothetical protein
MSEKTPKKIELTEEQYANLTRESENARASATKATEEANKAKKDLEALRRKREAKKPEPPSASTQEKDFNTVLTSNPAPTPEHGHTEGQPHYIGSWQRYCPTCGDQNPDFKDETTCDDCGVHLGAKEIAAKLKACPNCGGHSASVIKK